MANTEMSDLMRDGYQIVRNAFSGDVIRLLSEEVDRVAHQAGSSCVRHVASKSNQVREFAMSRDLLRLLPREMHLVRSLLFDKTADENWPVPWHQDLTIVVKDRIDVDGYGPWSVKDGVVHVQPPLEVLEQMVTLRVHLDHAPESNGALRVAPGSSAYGKIDVSRVKDCITSEVVCECSAGDVLLLSPLVLHASRRSEAPKRRRVLHFEFAPEDCLDSKLNWYER